MPEKDEETVEQEGEITLVGTAHVSQDSVDRVRESIEEKNPDVVAVELDERRYQSLKNEKPEDLEARDLLKGSKPFEFLLYWLLSYIQKRMGEKFDIQPGADMMAAVEEAEANNIPVALVDRDIRVTVQRMWSMMSIREKFKFIGAMVLGLMGFGDAEEIEDIEDLAEGDVAQAVIEEFRKFSPRGAQALIDERDAYIAANLVSLRQHGKNVVAVVGAGHKAGIEKYLESPETIPDIESFQKENKRRFSLFKAFGYLISIFVIMMFVLLFLGGADNELLARLFVYWFLINGVLAFAGALIAGGHLTSAVTGGLLAWMTSINPALAPGWFAGYVELKYIDVNVADIDRLNEILDDTEATTRELISRMYEVPMFRLLMVVALTNIGSIIGTGLFIFVVLPILGQDVDMGKLLMDGITNGWNELKNLVGLYIRGIRGF